MDTTTRDRYQAKLGKDATMGNQPVRLFKVLINIETLVLSSIFIAV